jgi:hypothetical protein
LRQEMWTRHSTRNNERDHVAWQTIVDARCETSRMLTLTTVEE